jgi:hypothetical protein
MIIEKVSDLKVANASEFICWYRMQYFPLFSEDLLESTSRSLAKGYDEARAFILAMPGAIGDRNSLAMLSVLEEMNKFGLALDTACYILRKLNTIAQPDETWE